MAERWASVIVKEYLVTCINECVSVLSLEDPAVKSAFGHEQR